MTALFDWIERVQWADYAVLLVTGLLMAGLAWLATVYLFRSPAPVLPPLPTETPTTTPSPSPTETSTPAPTETPTPAAMPTPPVTPLPTLPVPVERTPLPPDNIIWTVQRGDTLWAIAERFLGDGRLYKCIVDENFRRLRDPARFWLIYPGQVLVVPVRECSK